MYAPSHPEEPHPSDQTLLVLLAQTGDRAALEQLLRNSHALLRRYITRLAGADLADDILQETSIQIFRKLRYLREPAVFHAWTLRIASVSCSRSSNRTGGSPASGSRKRHTMVRVTPPAISEHNSGWLDSSSIPMSFVASCVRL